MATFFKTVNDKVLFTGDGELIYYVPEKYFNMKAAEIIGERVNVMGIFTYALFDKSGKCVLTKPFNAPTMIECIPNSISKESNYHLKGTKEPTAYRLLHFKKDDELICSTKVPVSFDVLEKFIKIFNGGNLPDNIPYDKIQDYILKNADLCKFDYKVSSQVIGMVISEIYRSEKDLSKPFRLSGSNDMLAYKAIHISKVPRYTSPFTAVTADNADEAIASAISTPGTGSSPLEKIVMT